MVNEVVNEEYITFFRNKWICSGAKTIEDFRDTYKNLYEMMQTWIDDGIKLSSDNGCVEDDYAVFCTTDPVVAEKYGFEVEERYEEDEGEFGNEEDSESENNENIDITNLEEEKDDN